MTPLGRWSCPRQHSLPTEVTAKVYYGGRVYIKRNIFLSATVQQIFPPRNQTNAMGIPISEELVLTRWADEVLTAEESH